MSLGHTLIHSLLTSGSSADLRAIADQYFTEQERPAYDFFRSYFRRYGQFPTVETMAREGFVLTQSEEPLPYYLDRCRRRALHSVMAASHPEYSRLLQEANPDEALGILQRIATQAAAIRSPYEHSDLLAEARGVVDVYREARRHLSPIGVTSGFPTIDAYTLGFQPGDITVVAGRPGMGKSYILLLMAIAAWRAGHSMLFVSMEMTLPQIVTRWIAVLTGINPTLIRKGELSPWGEDLMTQAVEGIEGTAPVNFIAGSFRKTLEDIHEAARFFDPDIVYIDAAYLLKLRTKGMGHKAKWETIGEVLEEAKRMAGDLSKPVVVTVQFNREMKRKSVGTPDLGSIAGTDTIGQIASLAFAILLGNEPYSTIRRRIVSMKGRDNADDFELEMNYRFNPMNFMEVSPDDAAPDTSWMV